MSTTLRSVLPWMGGKFHLAPSILKEFPVASSYDLYVEPFGGAAHVLIHKPLGRHVEIYNDTNGDLVNFWLQCRDYPDALVARLDSLPYSRLLYYAYHKSLFDGTELSPLERAARWFYVLRSSFRPEVSNTPNGWNTGPRRGHVQSYYNALTFFHSLAVRFLRYEIEQRDYELVIKQHESRRTFIYADPPYVDAEHYYQGVFNLDDHKRLARILNNTPAMVALSYYPNTLLDELYPANKWRRITWETPKHSQRTKATHDIATEMLLCNYPEQAMSLWDLGSE